MIADVLWLIALGFAWPIMLIGGKLGLLLELVWLGVLYWWLAIVVGKVDTTTDNPTANAAIWGLGAHRLDNKTVLKWAPKLVVWSFVLIALGVFIYRGFSTDQTASTNPPTAPAATTTVTDPALSLPPSVETAAAKSADVPLCGPGEYDCFRWYASDDDWAKPESCAGDGCETPWWRES